MSELRGAARNERALGDLPDEENADPVILGLERLVRSIWSDNCNLLPVAPLHPRQSAIGATIDMHAPVWPRRPRPVSHAWPP
jgi:hypothetical protein